MFDSPPLSAFPVAAFSLYVRLKLSVVEQLESFVYNVCLGVPMSIISRNCKTAINSGGHSRFLAFIISIPEEL